MHAIPFFKRYYILILSSVFLLIQLINNAFNMNDFQVYYRTGNRLLNQENLYRIASDGHYIFKYSPTFAFFSIPFSILPLFLAKLCYWIFLTLFFFFGSNFITKKMVPLSNKNIKSDSIQFLFSLVLSLHFMREVDLGQINLLLSLIFILSGILYFENKKMLSAVIIAFSLFLKPFALILFPFFVIRKDIKTVLLILAFTLFFLVIPCLFLGVNYISIQNINWINEMKIELSNKKDILAGGNHTIFSILGRYSPLFLILKQELIQKYYKLVVLFSIGISILWIQKKLEKNSKTMQWLWLVLLSWIPLLSYTSDNAFGSYCFPLILITLLNYKKNYFIYIAFFFIFLNPLEISHHTIFQTIFNTSIMGISAFYLLGLFYFNTKKNAIA